MLAIVTMFALAGCTIDVRPIKARTKHHSVRHSSHRGTSRSSHTPFMATVDVEWMKNYKALEDAYNYHIPDDERIKPEGNQFKVPKAVVDHYGDLIRANPTPKP